MVLIFNSLILKKHINHLGALPQLWYAFKHLLSLTDTYSLALTAWSHTSGHISPGTLILTLNLNLTLTPNLNLTLILTIALCNNTGGKRRGN